MAGSSRNFPPQGAKAVAFDVLFGELRPDHPPVQMANGGLMESDDFFALQMRRAGNILLAITPEVTALPDLFATNALALGDISSEKDSDGSFAARPGLLHRPPLASRFLKNFRPILNWAWT